MRQSKSGPIVRSPTKINHTTVSRLKYLFLSLLIILLFLLISKLSLSVSPETIKTFVLSFGILAPLVLIFLQALQSMISIIPSQVTTIAAGFLFGPIWGLVYTLIGATIGSSAIFLISRKYGVKLALKFFNPKDILHFQVFFKQKKLYALFLARIAPIFPNDLVSLISGLTNISFGWFTLISTIGFIIQMIILVLFGSRLAEGTVGTELITFSILVGILCLIVLFKKQIRRIVIKDLHKIEKSLKQGVKLVF